MSNQAEQAEQSSRALPSGLLLRAGQAVRRGLRELAARLWTSLWQIVIVAVIMASLVALENLTVGLALAAFVAFVASVALLPRQDVDQVLENDLGHSPASVRSTSAMHVMAEALPDPVILLNRAGQVLSLNGPARGLFASLREGSHISSVIRTPEFLDAVTAAPRRGRAVTVAYAERVPGRPAHGRDRGPAVAGGRSRRQYPRASARPHRDGAHQPDARRLHRQCEPRAAHAACLAAWLHRDPARARPRRMPAPANASCPSWPSRPRA